MPGAVLFGKLIFHPWFSVKIGTMGVKIPRELINFIVASSPTLAMLILSIAGFGNTCTSADSGDSGEALRGTKLNPLLL